MLDLWFPSQIYKETIENFDEINFDLKKSIYTISQTIDCGGPGWVGRPYNTCGTWNISSDDRFKEITLQVTAAVNKYCSLLGVDIARNPATCGEGWLNIYKHGDFQEFHAHAGFKISAVYYVEATESSSIYFESPFLDMNPLPIRMHSAITDQRADYKISAGQILVFRSYLKHCVPPLCEDGTRISLAFNFN